MFMENQSLANDFGQGWISNVSGSGRELGGSYACMHVQECTHTMRKIDNFRLLLAIGAVLLCANFHIRLAEMFMENTLRPKQVTTYPSWDYVFGELFISW